MIKTARIEEQAEENDKKKRSGNVIVHGVVESAADDAKKQDDDFAFDFIKNLHTKATRKRVSRIGLAKEDGKRRPILIALQSEDQKSSSLATYRHLKG